MITVDIGELPTSARKIAMAALEAGWRVVPGLADGPPRSIGLRMAKVGCAPVFAWWVEENGKWSFKSGLARDISRGIVKTQKALLAWLTVEEDADV